MNGPGPTLPIAAVKLTYCLPSGATPAVTSVERRHREVGEDRAHRGGQSGRCRRAASSATVIATAAATRGTAAARTRIAVRRDTARNASRAAGPPLTECLHFRGGSALPERVIAVPRTGHTSALQSAGSAALRLQWSPANGEGRGTTRCASTLLGRLLAYGLSARRVRSARDRRGASGNTGPTTTARPRMRTRCVAGNPTLSGGPRAVSRSESTRAS